MKNLLSLRDERGLTIIELMLSLLLMSILFIGVWGIFANGFTFWRQAEYKVDMYDSLRVTLDHMGRELMFTRQPVGTTVTGGVRVPSNSSNLYFINAEGNTICYYCSGYALYRKENGNIAQPLASDIQSVGFTYYNRAGTAIDPTTVDLAGSIRQVKIVLTAKKLGSTVSPAVLVQKISLRSL